MAEDPLFASPSPPCWLTDALRCFGLTGVQLLRHPSLVPGCRLCSLMWTGEKKLRVWEKRKNVGNDKNHERFQGLYREDEHHWGSGRFQKVSSASGWHRGLFLTAVSLSWSISQNLCFISSFPLNRCLLSLHVPSQTREEHANSTQENRSQSSDGARWRAPWQPRRPSGFTCRDVEQALC